MIQAAKRIGTGTGLATMGLIGAGVGIGVVFFFGSLILGVSFLKKRNPSIRGQLFSYAILGFAFSLLLFFSEETGLFALMMGFCYYLLHKDIRYKEKTEII